MADALSFSGIEWDAGNRAKCEGHGVSRAEIESMFHGAPTYSPDVAHSDHERRYIAVGPTEAGRSIFVVFTLRERGGETLVRPISARYMHEKEIRRHDDQRRKESSGPSQ
jgi:uncharacterized DUF497 family protein